MMVSNRGSVFGMLVWQWKYVLFFTAAGVGGVLLNDMHPSHPALPTIPLAVFGAALGIFVSFRTNQAYARWWEARGLWGRIVNASRHLAAQVIAYAKPEVHAPVLKRQIQFAHVLRCVLRDQDPFLDEKVMRDPPNKTERNIPAALLSEQIKQLTPAADPQRMFLLDQTIWQLTDALGGCERIKRTPMPRGYGFIAERLLLIYGCVFPLCIVNELHWWAVPVNLCICLGFALISEAGRVLEDPFTMFYNGLPLSALSTTIEINLLQRLGESALPDNPKVNDKGILM